ncbi:MAG: hypothetical protein IIZ23_07770, partial [Ruminococcus sp.]|nr:hypothetical protein [Ruminococcus sp.]
QVYENEKWKKLNVKAVSLNANEPGKEKYSRDFTYYENLIANASDMGVNCIEAKELLPPEFYAAVSRHNKNNKDKKIYIIQRVKKPDGLKVEDYVTDDGLEAWKNAVQTAVEALHGNASIESERTG